MWETLKNAVRNVIKTNDNQEITGQVLQDCVVNIINNIGGNATCKGVAQPTTNPGAPDGKVYYFATQGGTYTNFDNTVVKDGLTILFWEPDIPEWVELPVFEVMQDVNGDSSFAVSQKAVNDALSAVNAESADLSSRLDKAESDISGVQTTANNAERTANSNKLTISQHGGKITTLEGQVGTLTTRTDNIEDTLNEQIQAIGGELDNLSSGLSQITPVVNNVDVISQENRTKIAELTSTVNAIDQIKTITLDNSNTYSIANLTEPGVYMVQRSNGMNVGCIVASSLVGGNITSVFINGDLETNIYGNGAYASVYYDADIKHCKYLYHEQDLWYEIDINGLKSGISELSEKIENVQAKPKIEAYWVTNNPSQPSSGQWFLAVRNAEYYLQRGYVPMVFRNARRNTRRNPDGLGKITTFVEKGIISYHKYDFYKIEGYAIAGTEYQVLNILNGIHTCQSGTPDKTSFTNNVMGLINFDSGDGKIRWNAKNLDSHHYSIKNAEIHPVEDIVLDFWVGFIKKPAKYASRVMISDCVSNIAKFSLNYRNGEVFPSRR